MKRIVPEFKMRAEGTRRAGFIPSDERGDVELWSSGVERQTAKTGTERNFARYARLDL